MKFRYLVLALSLFSASVAFADDSSTLDAAVGGGVGGAIGAAIGNEVGGKDGAIIGGAVGSATGVAVNVDDDDGHHRNDGHGYTDDYRNSGNFCPPGQAKKGNC